MKWLRVGVGWESGDGAYMLLVYVSNGEKMNFREICSFILCVTHRKYLSVNVFERIRCAPAELSSSPTNSAIWHAHTAHWHNLGCIMYMWLRIVPIYGRKSQSPQSPSAQELSPHSWITKICRQLELLKARDRRQIWIGPLNWTMRTFVHMKQCQHWCEICMDVVLTDLAHEGCSGSKNFVTQLTVQCATSEHSKNV